MSGLLSIPLLACAAALQATLIPQIRLLGGAPELVFLTVLAWSINSSLEDSILWAFVGGIAQDLLSVAPTGTSVVGMLFLVFAVSGVGQQVFRIGIPILFSLIFLGTIINHLMTMFILTLAGFQVDWLNNLTFVTAPTIVYNLVFILPIYWLVRRLQKRVVR